LIALVCLLALSGSALSAPSYGGYGSSRVLPLPEMPLEPVEKVISTGAYGSSLLPVTKTFTGGYGSSMIRTLEPEVVPEVFETRADILCRGQRPETVIPIDNNRKFVVCIDEGKGTEQECPFGLWFHEGTQRCERKLGPSDNLCMSSPCFNGGNCIPTDSWFRCECAPGFDGDTCELDARICQTQRPCGPSGLCQSFRFGAALSYVCIFDGGLRYGPNPSTTFTSPCDDLAGPGPHVLGYTDGGFIMCNGPLMHIESCPGGTKWDVLPKSCSWPDMVVIEKPTSRFLERSNYGGYGGETRSIMKSSYGGERIFPKVLPTLGYGERTILPKVDSYGAEKVIFPKVDSYGAEKVILPKVDSYGAEKVIFPKVDSYGAEKVILPKVESYGAEKVFLPKVSGYGAEKMFLPKVTGYGSEKLFVPKMSGYGAEKLIVPRTRVLDSYGGERLISSGYGAEKVLPRVIESVEPVQSYGGGY